MKKRRKREDKAEMEEVFFIICQVKEMDGPDRHTLPVDVL